MDAVGDEDEVDDVIEAVEDAEEGCSLESVVKVLVGQIHLRMAEGEDEEEKEE